MTQLFDVRVYPEAEMFLIDVDGVGISQTDSLQDVETTALDLIEIMLEIKPDDVALNVMHVAQSENFVKAEETIALLEALPGINVI
ncbi:MAG: hypothetical protein PHN51_07105 [Candidatus Nanopelagicales bacterium]|nr:hypothetical protein [Candidatus Nanopelagicales bacterium]